MKVLTKYKYTLLLVIVIAIFLFILSPPILLCNFLIKSIPPHHLILFEEDRNLLENNEWEYDSGYKIDAGDFIIFNRENCEECIYYLKGDTIFYRTKPEAIIIHINFQSTKIFISSIDGNSFGSYEFDKAGNFH